MENKYKKHPIHNRGKFDLAFLFILIGGLLLAFNIGIIPTMFKGIIISWQMLLIVIGVMILIKKQIRTGVVLIVIGSLFIVHKIQNVFPGFLFDAHIYFHDIWPVILILVGLFLLMKRPSEDKNTYNDFVEVEENKDYTYASESSCSNSNIKNIITENILFGSSERIVLSPDFQGGEINVLFGELKLDLRKSSLTNGNNHLEANALFGSVIIFVPSYWRINLKRDSLFGAVSDKRIDIAVDNDKNAPVLNLKAACIFGSIEIRN